MRKKLWVTGLCAVLAVGLLTACSNGSTEDTAGNTEIQAQEDGLESGGENMGTAEAYVPEGTYNIRVFAAAGGVADTVTRLTAQSLQEEYGITPVISNLTGANGAVAAADMEKYDPDIHEMSLVSMSLFTMAPLMNPELDTDLNNYAIVGSLIKDEFVLLVSKDSGIQSWEDLEEYGQTNKIIYASNTPGGGTHIVQTALFGEAGLDSQALTSDGSNKDILAVMSGDAVCTAATTTLAKSYVDSGDLLPIAIFSETPYAGYEGIEVPSIVDLGYEVTVPSYNFLITRAGVSGKELSGMYDAILACRETETFKEAAAAAEYVPDNTDGEALKAEIEKYAEQCEEIYNKYY